jgi:hypothetical protein
LYMRGSTVVMPPRAGYQPRQQRHLAKKLAENIQRSWWAEAMSRLYIPLEDKLHRFFVFGRKLRKVESVQGVMQGGCIM